MKRPLLALALCALALPALAQDAAADWDLVREGQDVSAVMAFDPGLTFIARCMDRRLDLLIAGLPSAPDGAGSRRIRLAWGEAPAAETNWIVGRDRTVAASYTPAWLTRSLRAGGELRLTAGHTPDAPGTQYRYAIDPSASAINEVLTACATPLDDPRDAQMAAAIDPATPESLDWIQRPLPEYPGSAEARGIRNGEALLTCFIEPDGSFSECRVESESRSGVGFGTSAVRSMREARVAPASARPPSGQAKRLVTAMIRFSLG